MQHLDFFIDKLSISQHSQMEKALNAGSRTPPSYPLLWSGWRSAIEKCLFQVWSMGD